MFHGRFAVGAGKGAQHGRIDDRAGAGAQPVPKGNAGGVHPGHVEPVKRRQILGRVGADAQSFDPSVQPLPEVGALQLRINSSNESFRIFSTPSDACSYTFYRTTNLMDWSAASSAYSPATTNEWELSGVAGQSGYYRGTRVSYPQAVTWFSHIERHHVFFQQGTNVLSFAPAAGGTGTCDIAGTADTLTYWDEWTTDPYVGRVVFQPSDFNAFQFIKPVGQPCYGYQYSSLFGWQYIGDWTFGEQDATPE